MMIWCTLANMPGVLEAEGRSDFTVRVQVENNEAGEEE